MSRTWVVNKIIGALGIDGEETAYAGRILERRVDKPTSQLRPVFARSSKSVHGRSSRNRGHLVEHRVGSRRSDRSGPRGERVRSGDPSSTMPRAALIVMFSMFPPLPAPLASSRGNMLGGNPEIWLEATAHAVVQIPQILEASVVARPPWRRPKSDDRESNNCCGRGNCPEGG